MIRVQWVPRYTEAANRDRYAQIWTVGMRVRDVLPDEAAALEDGDLHILRNSSPAKLDDLLCDGDFVQAVRAPGDPITIALLAISFLAGELLQRMALRGLDPPERDDNSSPTYSFGGTQSQRGEGRPIPKYYGTIRVGGQVINEAIENATGSSQSSVYRVQISLGHGPIRAIGDREIDNDTDEPLTAGDSTRPIPAGIKVNGNEANNLGSCVAHVRLGANEQQPAPGFELLETRTAIGSDLLQVETSVPNPGAAIIAHTDTATAQNAVYDQYAYTFDLTQEADFVRVKIRFPRGWRWIDGTTPKALPWILIVRYRKLDGGGSPITTGGNYNDGWVRLPWRRQFYNSGTDFSADFVYPLYEPSTYTPVGLGFAFNPNALSGSAYAIVNPPTVPGSWTDGSEVAAMSWAFWVRNDRSSLTVDNEGTICAAFVRHPTPSLGSRTIDDGFLIQLRRRTFSVAPGYTQDRVVPVVVLYTGSTATTWHENKNLQGEPHGYLDTGETYHVVATYRKDVQGTADRLRIYIDGAMVTEFVQAIPFRHPNWAATPWMWGSEDTLSTPVFNGSIDEGWWINGELTPEQVFDAYNAGLGKYGPPTGVDAVLVHHFDDGTTSGDAAPQVADSSPYGNDASLIGNARTTDPGTVPTQAPSNTIARARYRVEVLRNVAYSTNVASAHDSALAEISGAIDEAFSYPGEPILSLEVQASEQLGTGIPQVTTTGKWRLCPVWDGVSVTNPNFVPQFSRFTADVAADIILDREVGLGREFGPLDIDLASLQDFRSYCREIVTDHRSDTRGNVDLTTQGAGGGDADGWINMVYDETTLDPETGEQRGTITVTFGASEPPEYWKAGKCVRWSGMQTPATSGINVNTNYPSIAGFEIKEIVRTGGTTSVVLWYDHVELGAPWNGSGSLQTALNPAAPTGTLEGAEYRHLYDAAHDTTMGAWDRLVEVCSTARAVPIMEGSRIRFRLNNARDPVAIVGKGDIIADSWEHQYEQQDERTGCTVEFFDEDLDWDRSTEYDEHPSVQASASLAEVRVEDIFVRGIGRRSAAHRHARFRLNARVQIDQSGRFQMAPDRLSFRAGDVIVLAHDLVPWGVSGRCYQTSTAADEVYLDRQITVTAGDGGRVRVRNSVTGQFETVLIDDSGGTITYDVGDAIPLTASLTFTPQKYDLAVFYEEGEEFLADVVDATIGEDLICTVEWVKYDATVYDDDFGPLDIQATSGQVPATLGDRIIPQDVVQLRAEPRAVRRDDGGEQQTVALSWGIEDGDAARIGSFRVWARPADDPIFQLVAQVDGGARAAQVQIPASRRMQPWVLAVQPVSHGGARKAPDRGPAVRVRFGPEYQAPPRPDNLTAVMVDDQVVYQVTPGTGGDAFSHELRRGGWILGQRVGTAPPGVREIGPIRNWATGPENAGGMGDPSVIARSKSASGRYSPRMRSHIFRPIPAGITAREDTDATHPFFSERIWEDFGDGWIWDGATTPNAAVNGLQRRTPSEYDWGELEFVADDLILTATYTTPEPVPETGWPQERYYVEAIVVAYQMHPATWDELPWPWNHPAMDRWTWEGPLDQLDGETAACELRLEIRTIDAPGGSWTDWRAYSPGIYAAVAIQLRIWVQRPNSSYQVRIVRFAQRVSRVAPQRWERAAASRLLASEAGL